jgi:DNA-binding PadR family transcriptional regulator
MGEFEETVLAMVGILNGEAYGNSIVQELHEKLGRESHLSAVHVTLYRLEDKGYVRSHYGGETAERGGRRKRLFEITQAGLAILHERQAEREKIWKLLPQLKFNGI